MSIATLFTFVYILSTLISKLNVDTVDKISNFNVYSVDIL